MIKDYNVLKELKEQELKELIPSNFSFKRKPWIHQMAAFIANIANDGFNDWLDLGTGKSKVAIDTCRYWADGKPNWTGLVICLNTAVGNWKDEVKLNSDFRITLLSGTTEERWEKLKGAGIFIINYEGLRWMLTTKRESPSGKKKLYMDPKKIRAFLKLKFSVLIIDESHKIRNYQSLNFKICARLARDIDRRTCLTGTPYGKKMLGIWSQYFIADFGETFSPNVGSFRDAYFVDKGWFGPDWRVTDRGRKVIESKMFRKALRYNEAEIKELPPKTYRVLKYDLSKEQKKAYEAATEKIGVFKDLKNKSMVFRQICGGVIVKTEKIFKDNPKLSLLIDLIESVVENQKLVVYHEFVLEGVIIRKALQKLKIKFNQLNGQVKDKYKEYKTFEKNEDFRVMVAHPISGGSSINLNIATYCVFYSNNHSAIERRQCEKRIHRGKIKRRRFYYDLVANNSIEIGMYKDLKKGKDFFDKTMDKGKFLSALKGR